MTSDVFGERPPESLDGLGYDQTRGSFEEIHIKVTCPNHVRVKSSPEH